MADANTIFSSETPSDITVDVGLNDLVGEDRKYKDPDDLAKAYAHLERHAKQIEAENARIRSERDVREANNTTGNPNPGQEQPKQGDNPSEAPHKAPQGEEQNVDFRSQIREEVKALNESERATANMEAAAQKLIDIYGSPLDANKALQKRANELNVSVDWLRDSAGRSPSAFYATMGITQSGGESRSTPGSGDGVRMGGAGEATRNFEYFDKLRTDNPKLYFSAATQREMMNEARKQGADFYKR